MVKYSTPNFVFNTSLSENEFKTVKAKATELENYLTTYFAKDVVVEDVAELDGVEALESLDF